MSRETEHKCKEMRKYFEVYCVDGKHIMSNPVDGTFIQGIKFCPWCGANLEDEK